MTARKIASTAALAFLLSASMAAAQTSTSSYTPSASTTVTTPNTTVTTPNTGAGGNAAQNILVLGSSAVIAIAGGAFLARRFARQ